MPNIYDHKIKMEAQRLRRTPATDETFATIGYRQNGTSYIIDEFLAFMPERTGRFGLYCNWQKKSPFCISSFVSLYDARRLAVVGKREAGAA